MLQKLDRRFIVKDVIKFQDILLPGLETTYRNIYYAMNGVLLAPIVGFATLLGYAAVKVYHNVRN